MIAVAVVAILTAIVFPSFMDSIKKGRRSDAFTALNAVAQAQERWRANNSAYASNLTAAPTASPGGLGLSTTSSNGYYTISIDSSSATAYEVIATAVSGKSQASDGACVKLGLRMNGGNMENGSSASGAPTYSATDRCWSR
jgi:type IV pilus assembly protein PilE